VTGHRSLRLTLVPAADGSGISGRLRDEDGDEHRFSSWLGLLSLLESAHGRAPTDAPDPDGCAARAEEA